MAESLVQKDFKCYAEDSLRKFDKHSSNIDYCMFITGLLAFFSKENLDVSYNADFEIVTFWIK